MTNEESIYCDKPTNVISVGQRFPHQGPKIHHNGLNKIPMTVQFDLIIFYYYYCSNLARNFGGC